MGLTFNMDTLIATWVYYGYCLILITVLATRGRPISACRLAEYSGIYIGRLRGAISSELGRHWPMVSSLLFTFFLFIFVGNELGLILRLRL